MKTDTEIKIAGTTALLKALGELETEKFIALITREPFDYTDWQRDMWSEKSIEELSNAAMNQRKKSK